MFDEKIPAHFVQYAADILGDTSGGLSGANIVLSIAAYAVEYDVNIPHPTYPFEAPNKRTALYENLMAFDAAQQYRIIKELCEHRSFPPKPNKERKELKVRLVTRYSSLAEEDEASEINETLIEETRHWLDGYPEALSLYNNALEKYEHGRFLIGAKFRRSLRFSGDTGRSGYVSPGMPRLAATTVALAVALLVLMAPRRTAEASCEWSWCTTSGPKTTAITDTRRVRVGDLYAPAPGRRVQIRDKRRNIIGYIEADGTVTDTRRNRVGTIEALIQ